MTAREIADAIEQALVAEVNTVPLEDQVRELLSDTAWKEWLRFVQKNPTNATVISITEALSKRK